MTVSEVTQLSPGDSILWYDPDNGSCSKPIRLRNIVIHDADGEDSIIEIVAVDGEYLECLARELSQL